MYLALDDREDLPEKVLTEMKLTRKWVLAIVGDKWPLQHRHVCLWSNKRVRRHHQI